MSIHFFTSVFPFALHWKWEESDLTEVMCLHFKAISNGNQYKSKHEKMLTFTRIISGNIFNCVPSLTVFEEIHSSCCCVSQMSSA